jgi:hypothetical protein
MVGRAAAFNLERLAAALSFVFIPVHSWLNAQLADAVKLVSRQSQPVFARSTQPSHSEHDAKEQSETADRNCRSR